MGRRAPAQAYPAGPRKRMPRAVVVYVRLVDRLGRAVGVVAMLLTFVLAGILLESSVARLAFGTSHIWSVELAQFTMSAYYLLGGALSEQDGVHVRMDLFYSRLPPGASSWRTASRPRWCSSTWRSCSTAG